MLKMLVRAYLKFATQQHLLLKFACQMLQFFQTLPPKCFIMLFHNTAASSYKVCIQNVIVFFFKTSPLRWFLMLFHNIAASSYNVACKMLQKCFFQPLLLKCFITPFHNTAASSYKVCKKMLQCFLRLCCSDGYAFS